MAISKGPYRLDDIHVWVQRAVCKGSTMQLGYRMVLEKARLKPVARALVLGNTFM